MIDQYIQKAKEFLLADDLEIEETKFGLVLVKGNWRPSKSIKSLLIGNLSLDAEGVIHERVIIINENLPIRSHEETDREIVRNIGQTSINYISNDHNLSRRIPEGSSIYSVHDEKGFYHGFDLVEGAGMLYVIKRIKPEYVKGRSFTIPENSYKP